MHTAARTRIARKVSGFIGVLAAFLAWGGCTSLVRCATSEQRTLTYVGRVSFGTPQVREGQVIVPLIMAGGGWGGDSGTALSRVQARVSGRTIEMSMFTAVVGHEPVPEELRLGKIPPGQYSVSYRDPDGTRHPLGQIEIPAKP